MSTLCTQFAVICNGELLHTGDPDKSVMECEGKIFAKSISKHDIEKYKAEYSLLSTQLKAGQLFIRVLAESAPGDGFMAASPTLEDVYFCSIARQVDINTI